jgi:hypothetical protein
VPESDAVAATQVVAQTVVCLTHCIGLEFGCVHWRAQLTMELFLFGSDKGGRP